MSECHAVTLVTGSGQRTVLALAWLYCCAPPDHHALAPAQDIHMRREYCRSGHSPGGPTAIFNQHTTPLPLGTQHHSITDGLRLRTSLRSKIIRYPVPSGSSIGISVDNAANTSLKGRESEQSPLHEGRISAP